MREFLPSVEGLDKSVFVMFTVNKPRKEEMISLVQVVSYPDRLTKSTGFILLYPHTKSQLFSSL